MEKTTQVSGPIRCEFIPYDNRYVKNTEAWSFYSTVVRDWCDAPAGFVHDTESVPIIRGTNREAGAGHDLVCRYDFVTRQKGLSPTKLQAARIYLELQRYFDGIRRDSGLRQDRLRECLSRGGERIKRGVKTAIVIVAPGYWRRHKVAATYEELRGIAQNHTQNKKTGGES